MNPTAETTRIESIEEYALYALDRSTEGLNQLIHDCRQCAEQLSAQSPGVIAQLSTLAVNLRDFDVFIKDIASTFEADGALLSDSNGEFQKTEQSFRASLEEFAALLGSQNLEGLAVLLDVELPGVLTRFQSLIPVLKDHIDVQYIRTSP